MNILRTPDSRFKNLPDFPYEPHYTEVDGLRMAHVEAGSRDGEIVLLLHGEPTWSFLYRHMIPIVADAGFRPIAPDMPGFGRSDKPTDRSVYSYQQLVDWMTNWLLANDFSDITLVCQDWGSLIGLRMAAENPERFARIVVANGGLPTGDFPMPPEFLQWQSFSQQVSKFQVGRLVSRGCTNPLSNDVIAGYDAPFPDESYKEGPRILPSLVPTAADDPATKPNRKAFMALRRWDKPFLTAFSDGDPITRGADLLFQKHVPGAAGQPHTTIVGAGHFLQEERGPELARIVVDFMQRNPLPDQE
ncbi:MAG: haloalkane dehalogenase [Anaerolineae bacterium]|nr:haloalkane dehalogenase [Anaerolineae bacterium]